MKRKRLTNEQLTDRIIELGALLGAVQKHFLDFRSGCNRDLDNAIERITALETRMKICPADIVDKVKMDDTDLTCGKCLQSLKSENFHVLCPYLHEWRKPTWRCHPRVIDTLSRLARDGELRSKT